jgi:Trk K+ transport system NAD-binding subunit
VRHRLAAARETVIARSTEAPGCNTQRNGALHRWTKIVRPSWLEGRRIADVEGEWPRLRFVALTRTGEATRIMPAPDVTLEAGDLLVVIGQRDALGRLAQASTSE